MKIKRMSDDLYSIFERAAGLSKKYFHSFCGTGHLFLALFGFLSGKKDDPRYGKLYTSLKEILNKYNIDGAKLRETFTQFYPCGTEPAEGEEFEVTADAEFNRVKDELIRLGIAEKRTLEVEDFIPALFHDKSYAIFMILADIVGSTQETEKMYDEIIKKFRYTKNEATSIKEFEKLNELTNLNRFCMEKDEKYIGDHDAIDKIKMCLCGRTIPNVVLTGPAGTGKTQAVHEFVNELNRGNVPDCLKNKVVYELNCGALVAGTRYRGDMEEKLINILNVCKKNPNVILFVDEIHSLVNLGESSDGASSAGNIIKPYITRGEIQIIGATTDTEYTKTFLKDKAFARRFHECKIQEPTREETIQILEGLLPVETEFFNKKIQHELLERVVDLSQQYTLDQANPAKSINMLELACAYSKVFEEKNETVDVNAVIQSVKLKYEIYISDTKYEDTKKALHEKLLGQDNALDQVCRNLKVVEKGLCDVERPRFSMLLAGPTG